MTQDVVATLETGDKMALDWGHLTWLIGAEKMPGAELTVGLVRIEPGKRNPLHSHPNCEEVLYVVSGACEHKLGDDMLNLSPGAAIRIPRGVPHWARCTSAEPLVAVISFSSGDRRTDSHEGAEVA
ncbi:cupin domain-containing protein [Terrarubrum flagellatum]|uniref:cupin domain-containing protein n=1 Tax=Terrirubrum flagellatum TaxID=2895980 RepID=UPI00314561AB